MTKKYDLVVIGTGTAAQVAALKCRSAGWRVAVIDHLPFGGTCALRGCDPKKLLVGAAEAIDHTRRMRVAEAVYGFKVLVEEETNRILGAHLVGPHVDEVINVFGLAIRLGLTAEDLKSAIFGYPTGASDIGYML